MKEEELIAFQMSNCTGCRFADKATAGTGAPCCTKPTSPRIVEYHCLDREPLFSKN